MYKLLLTFRYLRRKLIPLFALLAVTLCTAMLIVVLSIMGGFHDLLLNSGTKLIGDVQLYAGVQGISDYDKILDEIRELPQTESAAATIQTIGLLQIPSGPTLMVEIIGADPDELTHVIHYKDTLYWSAERLEKQNLAAQYGPHDPVEAAMKLATPWPRLAEYPAMVMGIEVNPYNTRLKDGSYDFPYPLLARPLSLTLVPVSSRGGILEPATQQFVPVNEFHSGLYDADSKRIFIPFAVAQKMLMMDQATRVNPADPTKILGTIPARCTTIVVRAKAGYTADQLCAAVNTRYAELMKTNPDLPDYMQIRTWQELLRKLLDTVQNEKNLMTFLFGIISVVAIIMVLVIFYMIVLEKTRDIGILRALGASRLGVASIFLTYAGVIGVIGSALGTLIAYLIVHYINEIHQWLGDAFGIVIWDRRVYFFDQIPNQVNWHEIALIVLAAIIASVLGSIVPAVKAALVDPVQSLRYE